MCCSSITQIVYGALILVALALTIGAMFTPGWSEFKKTVSDSIDNQKLPEHTGILPFACVAPGGKSANDNGTDCKAWWDAQPKWIKVVAVLMGISVVLQVLGFVWNLVTFFACCCKRFLIQPLVGASLVASITLAIAVILYYIKNESLIQNYKEIHKIDDIDASNQVSYSFYLALGGLVASILSFIAASVTQWFAQKSL